MIRPNPTVLLATAGLVFALAACQQAPRTDTTTTTGGTVSAAQPSSPLPPGDMSAPGTAMGMGTSSPPDESVAGANEGKADAGVIDDAFKGTSFPPQ